MARPKTFNDPVHAQTPKKLSVKINPVAEVAFWWLRRQTPFTKRQVSGSPAFANGTKVADYPNLAELLGPGDVDCELGEAARMGIVLAALAWGCEHPSLVEFAEGSVLVERVRVFLLASVSMSGE